MGVVKVLKSMVLVNCVLEVMQLNGVVFGEWVDFGFLFELDNVVVQGNWEKQMFFIVWFLFNNYGYVVVVLLGIYCINLLFYNMVVFKCYNFMLFKIWDDFDQIVKKLQGIGIVFLVQSVEVW